MARELSLAFEDIGQKAHVHVVVRFENSEWNQIQDFIKYAHELFERRAIQDGLKGTFSIRWSAKAGWEISGTMPPWDDVMAMLLGLRPFLLEDEPTSFFKTCAMVGRRIEHPCVRSLLKSQKEVFRGIRSQRMMTVKTDGVVVNSHSTLMKWLNAYQYHRVQDIKVDVEATLGPFRPPNDRPIVFMLICDAVEAVLEVANFLSFMTRQSNGEKVMIRLK